MDVHRKIELGDSSPLNSSSEDFSSVEFHDEEKDIMKENKVKGFLLKMWSNENFDGKFQECKKYILNPESENENTELLKISKNDANLRNAIVWAITTAAYEDLSALSIDMLMIIKEGVEDTNFQIRKDSILKLASLYKKYIFSANLSHSELEKLYFIRNHILQAYFQPYIETRILVENYFQHCIIPFEKPIDKRMTVLLNMFCSFDNHTLEAFKEIIKFQSSLRWQMRNLLKWIHLNNRFAKEKYQTQATLLSDKLYDCSKSKTNIRKVFNHLYINKELCNKMSLILNDNLSYDEAIKEVNLIKKMFGGDNKNLVLASLLTRIIAPLTIDLEGIRHLVILIKDAKDCSIANKKLVQPHLFCKGLELLLILASNFKSLFLDEEICKNISQFLLEKDEQSVIFTIQILSLVICDVKIHLPKINENLWQILKRLMEKGTKKQAKMVVYFAYCFSEKEKLFEDFIEDVMQYIIQNYPCFNSKFFRSTLASLSYIAYLMPNKFVDKFKMIVDNLLVKDLSMVYQIEGMKFIVKWLKGFKGVYPDIISKLPLSTLNFLAFVINNYQESTKQHIEPENSEIKLSAAMCILKLCKEPHYNDLMNFYHYQALAYVFTDECPEVRNQFVIAVHNKLIKRKLPLKFLFLFSLGALDENEEYKTRLKNNLVANIKYRKWYLKDCVTNKDKVNSHIPEFCLSYAVFFLAHFHRFKSFDGNPELWKIQKCLQFLIEPFITSEKRNVVFIKNLLIELKESVYDDANEKLTCDIALTIVESYLEDRTGIMEFPFDPVLPSELFIYFN